MREFATFISRSISAALDMGLSSIQRIRLEFSLPPLSGCAAIAHCLAAMCLFSIDLNAQTSSYGKPAGFVRIQVQPSAQTLSSMPFIPFDGALNPFFDKQLKGEPLASSADMIVKWDVAAQQYVSAFKAGNTSDSAKDGKWFVDDGLWTPSLLAVVSGEAFWIQNRHLAPQNVFLCGKVVLDKSRTLTIHPNMNLLSYPFTSRLGLNSSALKDGGAHGASSQAGDPDVVSSVCPDASFWLLDGAVDPNNGKWLDSGNALANMAFSPGNGYWYNRRAASAFAWTEIRPYQNPFNVTADAPEITGMSPNASLDGMTLTISCTGAAGETLEIFFKDIAAGESLSTESGWQIAASGIATNGSTNVAWTDLGESSPGLRTPVTSAFMRVYLVSRQDCDTDEDGISDGREMFVYGTNPYSCDSDGDGLSDFEELFTFHTNPNSSDTDGDGFSDYLEAKIFNSNPNVASSFPSDSTPPSAPSGLTMLAASASIVSLSWSASTDNAGVANYRVFRDGREVARTLDCAYADFNLAANTSYSYTIKACDYMGNLSLPSSSINCATGYANATCRYVDGENGDDDNNGTSSSPKKTIKEAVRISAPGTVIVVLDGVYLENLELSSDLVLASKSGASKTEIRSQVPGGRPLIIRGATRALIVDGFRLSGGSPDGDGGGALIQSSSPVIGNCAISGNTSQNGGGVAVKGASAPSFLNCSITQNSASVNGGGVYFSQAGRPVIRACLIGGNSSFGKGGGIYGDQ